MSNETTNKFALINFPEIPNSVDNAAKNLTDKPSQNMGATLGDLWFLVFGSISQKADKRRLKYATELEAYKAELEASLAKIPEEKKVEPSTQVVAQALENSKYCIEEKELRALFTNLISSSMNSDLQKDVHPSFAEIIKQMSPLDARVIKLFKGSGHIGFPLCDICLTHPNGNFNVLANRIFLEGFIKDISACSQSISSLERLGLIYIPADTHFADDNYYRKYNSLIEAYKRNYPDQKITLHKGKVVLTPLGFAFVRTCIAD